MADFSGISASRRNRTETVRHNPSAVRHPQSPVPGSNLTTAVVSQRNLVSETGVQEAQLSFMVKSLKAKKLVRQRAHPGDSRIRAVEITPAGVTMLNCRSAENARISGKALAV